ncbi:phosphoglucomutase [Treponema phagedenis]|uniref:Phosphoglucomutase/phosphomannomutase, alpha/beta/alpha domain I n=1 Tax=Treponema phagedenis TaxID=162 RepID=A0A0B7GVM4_TREPH|nr:phosphoglucomutase [Treponema phagedenis]QEK01947.1 phosphoglucomutase [Treponema phagedenis]QEK07059.1 phosphoglucomutase [Treponema phagedenis]QSH98749.1 phosphoglucomutase [Treponema phagedenis]CEM62533.1 Phosphoglucomutase/phosphomannomutase, alpha/beta/alpha domain I [Treponema phagedenis]
MEILQIKQLVSEDVFQKQLEKAFSELILSASGWRKVFAQSGNEEDSTESITAADAIITVHAAMSFAQFLRQHEPAAKHLVVGRDSRPTGKIIAALFVAVLLAEGFEVVHIGIAAAPEIMSYARTKDAFVYVSASHNPIGHNGLKFGLNTGGVLAAEQSAVMIQTFKQACAANNAVQTARNILQKIDEKKLQAVFSHTEQVKQESLAEYTAFSKEVIAGSADKNIQNDFFHLCKRAAKDADRAGQPFALLADFNGSARAASIDRSFFEAIGIELFSIAEKAGDIRHRIVPEGESLIPCAEQLEKYIKTGSSAAEKHIILGYMPDCDGDRGNIVYFDQEAQKVVIPEAQSVFALCVMAELAHIRLTEDAANASPAKLAIAVNGPTSLRIDEIAAVFHAEVFRAEVGEANAVNLARNLREKGYTVRILGEGSNGGNITHPAAVRDPINTIFAILKLLLLRGDEGKKGLFEFWCSCAGKQYKQDFALADIFASLPEYSTTPANEQRALLKIKTDDHGLLKKRYQKLFEQYWKEKKEDFKTTFGIDSYRAIITNGTIEKKDVSDFSLSGKGGLKIQFYNEKKEPIAFIWMRGSGTEPVFRILADVKGENRETEAELLKLQADLVLQADQTG